MKWTQTTCIRLMPFDLFCSLHWFGLIWWKWARCLSCRLYQFMGKMLLCDPWALREWGERGRGGGLNWKRWGESSLKAFFSFLGSWCSENILRQIVAGYSSIDVKLMINSILHGGVFMFSFSIRSLHCKTALEYLLLPQNIRLVPSLYEPLCALTSAGFISSALPCF